MKNFIRTLFFVSCIVLLAAGNFGRPDTTVFIAPEIPIQQPDHKKAWARVDSMEQQGLFRSALEIVESIYIDAEKHQNANEQVKALLFKLKLSGYIEEEALFKAIGELEAVAASSYYPVQPIVHSILAETYWGYYQSNRYKFLNRTETAETLDDDLRTWDLNKLVAKVFLHYQASLEPFEQLRATSIDSISPLLIDVETDRKVRPTLYDLLAHRAINFYKNSETGLARPAYRFELKGTRYFSLFEEFAYIRIGTKDTASLEFHAIKTYQKLTRYHLSDDGPAALGPLELERLKFVKEHSTHPDKDSLYLDALTKLAIPMKGDPAWAEVQHAIAQHWYAQGQRYDALKSTAHKWELNEAIVICKVAIKKFPNSLGARNCKALIERIEAKSLSAQVEAVGAPAKPFRASVTFKNVERMWCRIVPISNEEALGNYRDKEKQLARWIGTRAIQVQALDLPIDGDHQEHRVEVELDGLTFGRYVLLLSPNEKFDTKKSVVGYTTFWISDLAFMQRGLNDGSIEIMVMERSSGKPVAGALVEIFSRKYNYNDRKDHYKKEGAFTSDADGRVIVPNPEDYRYFTLSIKKGEDFLRPSAQFSQYGQRTTDHKRRISTHFFLDRAIYRPGQTIFFKGIVLKDGEKTPDGKVGDPDIMPGHKEVVTFYDVNGQEVSTLELTTNEYGTYHGSFVAPIGRLTGQMRISAPSGNIYFRVEEYKRPRFEVKIDPVEGSYKLGEEVTVKGNAVSYSGAALNDAEVRYFVRREVRYPWWSWRGWNPSPRSAAMEIKSGSVQTASDGTFEISFTAIADKNIPAADRPVFDYTVNVDVVDISGETHSAHRRVSVGYDAMQVSVDIPGLLNVHSTDTFRVSAQNLNGQAVPAEGRVVVHQLEMPENAKRQRLWARPDTFLLSRSEFETAFPLDVYDQENEAARWAKKKKVFDAAFNTSNTIGLILNDLKNWPHGKYLVEVNTMDAFGKEVLETKLFTVFDPKAKQVPEPNVFWTHIIKAAGEPGEKAEVLIGSSEEIWVRYEIEEQGDIVHGEWLKLNKEVKKIFVTIEEKHRGNFSLHFSAVKNNRTFGLDQMIVVPRSDKKLELSFETFRDKLRPGSEEEWRIKIKGPGGETIAAEMLAAMYDASLDVFADQNWNFNIYKTFGPRRNWSRHYGMNATSTRLYGEGWNNWMGDTARVFDGLELFGYHPNQIRTISYKYAYSITKISPLMNDAIPSIAGNMEVMKAEDNVPFATLREADIYDDGEFNEEELLSKEKYSNGESPQDLGEITARKNLQETAFFFPDLMTDAEGNVVLKFTMPEALTRWKFLALAHSKDLKFALAEKEVVTQKELMVTPNVPRFLRKGDKLFLSAKVSNLSDEFLEGSAQLLLFDALTNEPADQLLKNSNPIRDIHIPKGESVALEWSIEVPEKFDAIIYRFVARAGSFTDGEEGALPVLSNRMLVTESMPLPIRKKGTRTWSMEKLVNSGSSKTLKNHRLTLEFTANPAWYAIQALPYMMEYPYECSEQIFSRYYANSIASHIANSQPRIKAVFEQWKTATPESFLSNLEKNQELKALVLEETPWVLQAKDESERKRRVGLLFDLQHMDQQLNTALDQLYQNRASNGGWPWFPGMKDSRYITQHIVTGFGHLDALGIKAIREDERTWKMVRDAVSYLDKRILEDYKEMKRKDRLKEKYVSATHIQYLYARSYFRDIPFKGEVKTAFEFFKTKAAAHWLDQNIQLQGMIALALFRWEEVEKANSIMRSLKERALVNEEMGMYWKGFYEGYSWHQMPVETHALMIEAFDEITQDEESVNDLRTFLLKQKQTNDWKTTKATADACFALLLRGTEWLSETEIPEIKVGNELIDTNDPDMQKEAGTGYFKTQWHGKEITPKMGNVSITKAEDGVSWGALYWQYFEDLDKITPAETPLQLEKKLFVERRSDTGPVLFEVSDTTTLQPGDLIKVRIELRVDRNMEYIHMKDMRASGLEPLNVLSQYKWQGGLGYYESTKDASTNFFMDFLPKGTYVFEYPLRVTHQGDMSNGITSIQCMYAPEFTAHSEGVRIAVGKGIEQR